MHLGRYSYGTPTLIWESQDAQLFVGNFCSIAHRSVFYLGGNHHTNWVTTYPFGHIHQDTFPKFPGHGHPSTKGHIVLGNDVWVGDYAVIMSGVKIGDGAVIANNSHVVKDVEPYSITGGNPAKHIKYRFTKEQIEKLLEIKWWNWDENKINEFSPLLCNEDIDTFINLATKTEL
jgi:acetyltransferase-like isoleucine patch superfamily enzyme